MNTFQITLTEDELTLVNMALGYLGDDLPDERKARYVALREKISSQRINQVFLSENASSETITG